MVIKPENYNVRLADNITIEGDIAKGQLLLPYAYQLMRMARLSNISVMHKKVGESDIRVEFVNGQGRIYITGNDLSMYLETGFIDIHSIIYCSEGVFKPGTLNHPGIEINGEATYSDGELKSDGIPSGSDSKTLTCKDPQPTITDSCGNTYLHSGDGEGYCSLDSMWQRKVDRDRIQPSLFSGKMKMFVQCLYGAKRSDYYAVPYISDDKLDWNGFVLSPRMGSENWCLYTSPENEFYFVNVHGSTFRYVRLTISAEGQRWIDEATISNRRIIEAYALATATIEEEIVTKTITGAEINGTPLYYGWQASWDGSSLDIVLHKGTIVGGGGGSIGGLESGYAWQAYHYTASISGSNGNLSCIVYSSMVGEPWNPTNFGVLVWIPQGAGHIAFPFNGSLFTRYAGKYEGAVLMCWYDTSDALQFVTHSYTPQSQQTETGSFSVMPVNDRMYYGQDERISDSNYTNRSVTKGESKLNLGLDELIGKTYVTSYEKNWYGQILGDSESALTTTTTYFGDEFFDNLHREKGVTSAKDWAIGTGYFEQSDTHSWVAEGIVFDETETNPYDRYNISSFRGTKLTARFEERTNATLIGSTVLILSDKSCTDFFCGLRQSEVTDLTRKTEKGITTFPVHHWAIKNPQTNQILATSEGVASIQGADDGVGLIKYNTGTIIVDGPKAEAPEIIYAKAGDTFIEVSRQEGDPYIIGGWFYINWLAGQITRGGSPTIKSSLDGEYDIEMSSGAIKVNNGFDGHYTVGYK